MIASGMVPSAMPGRMRCLIASQDASNSRVNNPSSTKKLVTWVASIRTSCRPDGGSQPSRTAKTYFSRNARKKTGMVIPISDPITAPPSSALPCRRAAK